MKALLHEGGRHMRVGDVPDPVFKPGKILIRVEACGICGGEISAYKAGDGAAPTGSPIIPGHEMAGVVLRSDTPSLPEGCRVAVSPNPGCGVCEGCRAGYAHLCAHRVPRTPDIGGGYAQMALVEPFQCYPLRSGIAAPHASVAEPLACALHSAARVNIAVGDRVVILGAGAGAQLFVQVAKLRGASVVAVADDIPERLRLAGDLGADILLDGYSHSPVSAGPPLEHGADVVINTRSSAEMTSLATQWCAVGGRVLCYGVSSPSALADISTFALWRKEISVVGSRSFSTEFGAAVRLLDAGRIDAARLVTRTVTLEETADALAHPGGHVKTVITP